MCCVTHVNTDTQEDALLASARIVIQELFLCMRKKAKTPKRRRNVMITVSQVLSKTEAKIQ